MQQSDMDISEDDVVITAKIEKTIRRYFVI